MCGAQAEGYEHHGCVYKEADEHPRCDDFRVRILLLVQVPCASDAQELTAVACSVQDQDDQVQNLKVRKISVSTLLSTSITLN
jgi:hypothetical protein